MRRILLRILLGLLGLAICGGVFLWWKLRAHVEPIPQVLAVVDRDPALIRIPGFEGQPELALSALRGSIAYFVLESRESMTAGEGRELGRALNRWQYGDDVKGFFIGDVEGLGFLKWKLDELAQTIQRGSRVPLYMDYEGAILRGFKLPKGHSAIVVLGKQGELLFRKSGKPTAEELDALRAALGAREPDPPPPAPAFSAGPLSTASCAGQGCVLVFLSRPVRVGEVPGVEGGKPRDDRAAWDDPDARLVGLLSGRELPAGKSLGGFVGTPVGPAVGPAVGTPVGILDGVKLAAGWSVIADDAKLRAIFEIGAGETAIIVVDKEGRLALRERGRMPLWKLAPLDDLLSLPPRRAR